MRVCEDMMRMLRGNWVCKEVKELGCVELSRSLKSTKL